ncbi:MAG TPA: ABC transporter permease [Bacteroidota bacterium]|nr:ABC transporter permease [Bacteroidota bacterium]
MNFLPELIYPAYSLWMRELIRFFRQRSRMIGVIGSPILFWFFIGSGLGTSFKTSSSMGGGNYLEYFFPGTLLLIMLFTAIFSTISIIEDRKEGFLQSVLVAPISGGGIALGKIFGGTTLAVIQAVLFLILAPLIGITFTIPQLGLLIIVLFLIGFGLTGLGFLIAWRMESTQGFHAIMNLFLIPLWLLSGSLFPIDGAPGWLRALMAINPLTYSVTATRELLYHQLRSRASDFLVCICVITAFCLLVFTGSMLSVRKKS